MSFEEAQSRVAHWSGTAWAFGLALASQFIWGLAGPFMGFSDTWQLVNNTGTTIVTFLMVFLIQGEQNRATEALQAKLDEAIRALPSASNRVRHMEDLSEEDQHRLRRSLHREES